MVTDKANMAASDRAACCESSGPRVTSALPIR